MRKADAAERVPGSLIQGGIGEPAAQGKAVLAGIVRREAYVLAYIDAFWVIAWGLAGRYSACAPAAPATAEPAHSLPRSP